VGKRAFYGQLESGLEKRRGIARLIPTEIETFRNNLSAARTSDR
jgi:hypothetical protein